MPTPSPLEYAPTPPMHRRRNFRLFAVSIALTMVAASAWWWGPPAWNRAQLLYWQHRCLTYTKVPGRVVFDSNPWTTVVPKEWQEFYSRYSPPGMQSAGTIYLGEMTSRAGNRRIVAIDALPSVNQFGGFSVSGRVFREDGGTLTLSTGRVYSNAAFSITAKSAGRKPSHVQVYSAGLDPTDHSHLKFSTRIDSEQNDLDAWLEDDDTLVIGGIKM